MLLSGMLAVAILPVTSRSSAQETSKPNRDPDAARLVTSDIPVFWRVVDKANLKDAADTGNTSAREAPGFVISSTAGSGAGVRSLEPSQPGRASTGRFARTR